MGELLGLADVRGRGARREERVLSGAAAERAGLDPLLAEDVLLLGRVQGGDREAFAALFDRHAPVVLGLLVRILGSRPEAEETLQEVFLQAWRQAGRYDPGRSTPRGWLLVLARSRALDLVRSRESRRRREAETSAAPEVAPVGTEGLEERERQAQVSSALGLLPSEQRHCIELAFFEGLTHTQIARRLDAPLGTVKSRIHLGMSKLRQVLSAP